MTRPAGNVPGYLKFDKKAYNNQHAGTIPARWSRPVLVVGKAGVPEEKSPQACSEPTCKRV